MMEQPHQFQRRDTFKQTIIVLMAVTCLATVTTCLHASFYLNRNLASLPPPATTVVDEFATSSKPRKVTTKTSFKGSKTAEHHGIRTLGAKSTKARKSRSIDSSVVVDGSSSWRQNRNHHQQQKQQTKRQLDFIIAGFPKTGTTSLLYAFGDHQETDIAPKERCAVINPMTSDSVALGKLQESLSELSASPNVKRAVKCPNAVYHAYSAIVRLEQHSPNAKFVIGIRHPVEMLQSYYNYRVTELYDRQKLAGPKKKMEKIPQLEQLVGVDKEWRGVSTDSTRFESYLMQFGKTKLEVDDMRAMLIRTNNPVERKNHHWAVKPNNFSIFLYTVDQLEDTNWRRSQSFRQGLQLFLGLSKPLRPVKRENQNHFVGKKSYPETVDICLFKYSPLRRMLLKQGARSAEWIEHEFLQSPDVVVANKGHFLESIRSWSVDPCMKKTRESKESDRGSSVLVTIPKTGNKKRETIQLSGLPKTRTKSERVFVGRGRNVEVIPIKL